MTLKQRVDSENHRAVTCFVVDLLYSDTSGMCRWHM